MPEQIQPPSYEAGNFLPDGLAVQEGIKDTITDEHGVTRAVRRYPDGTYLFLSPAEIAADRERLGVQIPPLEPEAKQSFDGPKTNVRLTVGADGGVTFEADELPQEHVAAFGAAVFKLGSMRNGGSVPLEQPPGSGQTNGRTASAAGAPAGSQAAGEQVLPGETAAATGQQTEPATQASSGAVDGSQGATLGERHQTTPRPEFRDTMWYRRVLPVGAFVLAGFGSFQATVHYGPQLIKKAASEIVHSIL